MPFKSKKQVGFMFANHPRTAKGMADRMKANHKSLKSLPKTVKRKK